MDQSEVITANAQLVIETFAEINLTYDKDSVKWLDGYIERNRQVWNAETSEQLISVLGSFLGECIRKNYGGEWEMTENGLGISFKKGNTAYPFNKIRKQIENGGEDSIASFYNAISVIFLS